MKRKTLKALVYSSWAMLAAIGLIIFIAKYVSDINTYPNPNPGIIFLLCLLFSLMVLLSIVIWKEVHKDKDDGLTGLKMLFMIILFTPLMSNAQQEVYDKCPLSYGQLCFFPVDPNGDIIADSVQCYDLWGSIEYVAGAFISSDLIEKNVYVIQSYNGYDNGWYTFSIVTNGEYALLMISLEKKSFAIINNKWKHIINYYFID